MPQIATISDNRDPLVERIPSGASGSSMTLRQAALGSILELYAGIGSGSELLRQAGIRVLEGFYIGSAGSSFSVQDVREFALEEILPTLAEIYTLLTWPDGWNGYDAYAPKYAAVQYACYWIGMFYLEIVDSHLSWFEPNVTASAEGEVLLEWRQGPKSLAIYVGDQSTEYVKDWGADLNTEMEDGSADSPSMHRALWKWLVS
jgi:hypothetical protein